MKIMRVYLLLVLSLFTAAVSVAQSSKISGIISQYVNGKVTPLVGATISVADSDIVVPSDEKGFYSIKINPGVYKLYFSFVGYATDSTMNIVVKAGQTTEVNSLLMPQSKVIKAVNVNAKKQNKAKELVTDIKKADNAVSGTGAADIQKTGDQDAAKIATRIPGVTVIDKFITIRGLNDRYTAVWLNNAAAPGAETDKRAFSFDIIPGGVIEKMLVYKTPSAELPGDFAGGMVKILSGDPNWQN